MLELKDYKKSDLVDLINDEQLWLQPDWATTRHRLQMHLHNPALAADDVSIVIAFYEGKMIGYIGAYEDSIHSVGGAVKIGWLHSWWINPEYRFTKAGFLLFEEMYRLKNGRIGISQFTPSAGRIYYKSGKFETLTKMHGHKVAFLLSISDLVAAKKGWVRFLSPAVSVIERLANPVIRLSRKVLRRNNRANRTLEYISSIDAETELFIRSNRGNVVCDRGKPFFDFLFKNRVIIEMPLASLADNRYFFSYKAERFAFYFVKVRSGDGTLVGFLVLQVRDRLLKLLFSYTLSGHEAICAEVVVDHAHVLNCSTLLTYEPYIMSFLQQNRLKFLYATKKEKEVLISKEFGSKEQWLDRRFNYGDGDCCFA